MLAAALNDFAFKIFADRRLPIGLYFAVIGTVWTLVFLFSGGGHENIPVLAWSTFWVYALLSGLFSAFANILLIEGMGRNGVGLCAAIYRLNLVPAALMGFLLLGENITYGKMIGIGFAVCAVLLFFKQEPVKHSILSSSGAKRFDFTKISLWLVMLAAFFRAGMGVSYKVGMEAGENLHSFLAVNGMVWVFAGILYHLWLNKGRNVSTGILGATVLWGLVSGILICGIVFFLALALKAGDVSLVLPIAQLSFMITTVLGIVFLKESLTPRKLTGFTFALGCVIFMSLE